MTLAAVLLMMPGGISFLGTLPKSRPQTRKECKRTTIFHADTPISVQRHLPVQLGRRDKQ
jgi:hypothetical protein